MIAVPNRKLVLCIPGAWRNRDALAQAFAERGRYLAAGPILLDLQNPEAALGLDFQPNDPRMSEAFRASSPEFTGPVLAAIARHRSVLYLHTEQRSIAGAHALMLAAAHALEVGGLAVKVETAGLAHSAEAWHQYCVATPAAAVHQALLVFVQGRECYSCGMHNMGLRDAVIAHDERTEALAVLRSFSWYMLNEAPNLQVGQSFATSAEGPVFQLVLDENKRYPADDLFYNVFGVWRLDGAAK
jgi:hypothetical protein